jgi:hypothetical protein
MSKAGKTGRARLYGALKTWAGFGCLSHVYTEKLSGCYVEAERTVKGLREAGSGVSAMVQWETLLEMEVEDGWVQE